MTIARTNTLTTWVPSYDPPGPGDEGAWQTRSYQSGDATARAYYHAPQDGADEFLEIFTSFGAIDQMAGQMALSAEHAHALQSVLAQLLASLDCEPKPPHEQVAARLAHYREETS